MSHDQPLTEQDLLMQEMILKEACKRESGFCPGCGSVLVPERTVSVDLIVSVSGHTLYRSVMCDHCYDYAAAGVMAGTPIPPEATWRVIDGRKIYVAPQHPSSG